jgi:hypothetical protein
MPRRLENTLPIARREVDHLIFDPEVSGIKKLVCFIIRDSTDVQDGIVI